MRGKSCLFLLFLSLPAAIAALVTTILDDAFAGDSQSSITYSPSNVWVVGSSTNHGRISPDPTQAFDSTWHDATDDTTPNHDGTTPLFIEVNFQGTGIDIRCIIANNLADPSIPPFTGTKANYSFFMDNVPQNKDFLHEAGTTGDAFLYNTSVFATNGLSAASHTLKLLLNGGPEVDGSVLLLFDYAIVTSDDESTGAETATPVGGTKSAALPSTTNAKVNSGASSSSAAPTSSRALSADSIAAGSSSPSTPGGVTQVSQSATSRPSPSLPVPFPAAVHHSSIGPIIGGLAGGVLALILLLLLICFWSRRKRSRRLRLPTLSPFTNPSASSSRPRFRFRSLISNKRASVPSPVLSPSQKHPLRQSPPSTEPVRPPQAPGTESNSDTSTREDVVRLRAEVDQLRAQQREMVHVSLLEPPPRYSQ
ncbi:hypothetical protein C8F04DRAFT_1399671 [Mycena alexandri]|uniref:Uncharacterized protein n=1 Tax=Mycena alexandri TaxID=1745969 RepID=A0AAD6SHG7_9AGAR|nr:hypothetical protein C8F04DRAFT_1399671 [Mycena alexandri]